MSTSRTNTHNPKTFAHRGEWHIVAYCDGVPLTILSTHPTRADGIRALLNWRKKGLNYDAIMLEAAAAGLLP